jgi:transcriptional regulator with XRE-family HTH domain
MSDMRKDAGLDVVFAGLPGRAKIRGLMAAKDVSVKDIAQRAGDWPMAVTRELAGETNRGDVREAIAALLEVDRIAVDEALARQEVSDAA